MIMSFPNLPDDIITNIDLDAEQVALLLLASIAFEELGLAHLINAEAEELEATLGTLVNADDTPFASNLDDLLAANRSVERILRTIIKKEMILEFKFENVLDLLATIAPPCQVLAYVVNLGTLEDISNTVSVIDTATDTVITTITVGRGPAGVEITPNGKRVYVANADDTVSVIDTATNIVIATVPAGDRPISVAITPDGALAYVTNINDNTVSVIETGSNIVIASITVGVEPFGIAIGNTPVSTRAYVANSGDNTVSVIDVNPNSPTFNTVIETITVGIEPIDVAITPDGTSVYVTNSGDNTVSVIDTATNTAITISVGIGIAPAGVGTGNTPLGTRAYVTNSGDNSTSIIDADSNSPTFNTVIAIITQGVGNSPSDAALTTVEGRFMYRITSVMMFQSSIH